MVTVRYVVDDVEAALRFYCQRLGFREVMHPAPAFAMAERGGLRLALSAPGGAGGGGRAMPDGTRPSPGGWNRFSIEVEDLAGTVASLRSHGVRFRNEIVDGVGGRQVLVEDPSGNPVELFEPTLGEARSDSGPVLRPVGYVSSDLVDPAHAPRQGDEGAPDAVLVFLPDAAPALAGLEVGADVVVLTWLHRADRGTLRVRPRGDPGRAEVGVFATRSPDRPNPIGLHPVRIVGVDGLRLHVSELEAVNGTPVLDIKPILGSVAER